MKRKLLSAFVMAIIFTTAANAQDYKTAAGLQIDFGDGTAAGPSIKYFFKENAAVEGDLLFGNGYTILQAFYQYHQGIPSVGGLQWYAGAGPSLGFGHGITTFSLRPMAGLDYKINGAPLAASFDWRPSILLSNAYGGSRFSGGNFGLGIKYVIN